MTRALSLLATVALVACVAPAFGPPQLVYSWTRMVYEFRTAAEAAAYDRDHIYERAPLAGMAVDRHGNLYVTTPRWLDARVPASLSRVIETPSGPVLRPFPSWAANALDRPGALRSVLGVAVDRHNRMWILDMGWVAGEATPPDGAQKLVVLDLDTGAELRRYAIPDAVADRRTSLLNDLAIDDARELAYITDSGNRVGSPTASAIILYDYKTNTARRLLDRDRSVTDDPARTLAVDGQPVFPGHRLAIGVNGIALSPDGATLYWAVTTGDALYHAPTAVLRDPAASPAQVAAAVVGPRRIGGGADGIASDGAGRIYLTDLAHDRINVLDPATGALTAIASGPRFIWPDTLRWDRHGGLYVTTNHLDHAFAGTMTFGPGDLNFRIFRIQTNTRTYP